MTDIRKLRELAEKASPGPWTVNGEHFTVCSTGNSGEDGRDYHVAMNGYAARDGADSDAKADASYIAAVCPTQITALLDRLERAEDAMRSCRKYANDPYKAPELIPELMLEEIDAVLAQIPESEDGGRGE